MATTAVHPEVSPTAALSPKLEDMDGDRMNTFNGQPVDNNATAATQDVFASVTLNVKARQTKGGLVPVYKTGLDGEYLRDDEGNKILDVSNKNLHPALAAVGSVTKPAVMVMLTSAAQNIVEAVQANLEVTEEMLTDLSGALEKVSDGCKAADATTTALAGLLTPVETIGSLVELAKGLKDPSTTKEKRAALGMTVARNFINLTRAGVKTVLLLDGFEAISVPDTVSKILKQVGHGLKVVANMFNFALAVNTLANKASNKYEKTQAIVNLLAAIATIAFFGFLLVATLVTMGAALPIVTAVLGSVFGLMMVAKGVTAVAMKHKAAGALVKAMNYQKPAEVENSSAQSSPSPSRRSPGSDDD